MSRESLRQPIRHEARLSGEEEEQRLAFVLRCRAAQKFAYLCWPGVLRWSRSWPFADRLSVPQGYTPNFSKGILANPLEAAIVLVFGHCLISCGRCVFALRARAIVSSCRSLAQDCGNCNPSARGAHRTLFSVGRLAASGAGSSCQPVFS